MKKALLILWSVTAVAGFSAVSQGQTLTPAWLRFLGDGSGGDFTCTVAMSPCTLGDEHWFHSFTVDAGAKVVTTGANGPIVIRSTNTCDIQGTVSDSPNSGAGVTITGGGDFGGSGGGGGGGTSAAGQAGLATLADANLPINAGGAGGAPGAVGGDGIAATVSQYRLLLAGGSFWPVGGSMGGQGGNNGGAGGTGGGPIIFVCQTINFTGTIDVSGGPGAASPGSGSGGGGGGGAGYVILSAVNYTANSGTFNTSGGTGGGCGGNSGCSAGGSGGGGWDVSLTIK